jgi:hypothetical protein
MDKCGKLMRAAQTSVVSGGFDGHEGVCSLHRHSFEIMDERL